MAYKKAHSVRLFYIYIMVNCVYQLFAAAFFTAEPMDALLYLASVRDLPDPAGDAALLALVPPLLLSGCANGAQPRPNARTARRPAPAPRSPS